MPNNNERQSPPSLTKEEKRALLVGNSQGRDEENIKYWQNATPEEHGRALYELLILVNAVGHYPEKTDMFPGFPKPRSKEK